MKKYTFFCIWLFFFVNSCSNKSDKIIKPHQQMSCKFYTRIIVLPYSSGCEMISETNSNKNRVSSAIKDTIIYDSTVIDTLNNIILLLSKDTTVFFGNACISCVIKNKNIINSICIDWNSNILLNNTPVRRNDTLNYIIKKKLGFYDYYSKDESVLIKWFPEYVMNCKFRNKL